MGKTFSKIDASKNRGCFSKSVRGGVKELRRKYGNGGYNPIPGGYGNIWSPSVPNGTYGVVTPLFGSVGNSNTTPQISGQTIVKGNGYVRVEHGNGHFTVYGDNGMVDTGTSFW